MGAVAGIPRTRGQVTSGSGAANLRRAPTVRRGRQAIAIRNRCSA